MLKPFTLHFVSVSGCLLVWYTGEGFVQPFTNPSPTLHFLRFCGFAVLRFCGFAVLWFCGFAVLWFYGFKVLRF